MQIVDIAIAVTTRAWLDHKKRVELEARRRKAEGLILTEAQVGRCPSWQTGAAAITANYWHSVDTQAYMKSTYDPPHPTPPPPPLYSLIPPQERKRQADEQMAMHQVLIPRTPAPDHQTTLIQIVV